MARNRTMKRDSFARKRVTALPADAPGVELSWRGWPRAEASTLQVVYIAFKMPVYLGQIYRREMVVGKREERERERERTLIPGNVPRPQFHRLRLVYRAEMRTG